ncbi:hypothetical protein ARUE_232p00210 (plasmid) [Arthrobacter sp. Rue61a]|nr:hypothetical protein ARUE_232p00210 [Arthrobacter sp. Rue61a]
MYSVARRTCSATRSWPPGPARIPFTRTGPPGRRGGRPLLAACLKALRLGDTLVVWKLVCGIFAALSEFERELISERTIVGLASARVRAVTADAPTT